MSNTTYNVGVIYKVKYAPVAFVDEGMTVWTLFTPFCPPELRQSCLGKQTMVRCTVAVAAGYHARIVNADVGIDAWVHIGDLHVLTPAELAKLPPSERERKQPSELEGDG